jgi:aspartate aminotransferase
VPEIVVQALRDNAAEKDYLPVEGLPALRTAVAQFHNQRDGAAVKADGVLVGPGSKELMFLTQLCFDGEIVLPSPCWVSYGPQAALAGRKVTRLMTGANSNWRLSAQQLDDHCSADPGKPRLMILNYPGNPDGDSYSPTALMEIAAVARKHGVIILSDEIYGLTHHQLAHVSIARFYPEGTVISSGLSKWCGAGGWRLGTFAFPPELDWLKEAVAVAASETFTSVSAPIQYAAIVAFNGGVEIDEYLLHQARVLRALGKEVHIRLRQAGVKVRPPVGGFYVWMDFSDFQHRLHAKGIRSSPEFCEALLQETGVAILPGASFERPPGELTARLAYVNFDGAKALSASQATPSDTELSVDFLTTHCPQVLQGIDALCRWIQP